MINGRRLSVCAGRRTKRISPSSAAASIRPHRPVSPGSCNLFYPGLVNNNSVTISTDRSEGEWSGTFELNYRPNDDVLLYGKFSRGNKAGGYNTGFLTLFAPTAAGVRW